MLLKIRQFNYYQSSFYIDFFIKKLSAKFAKNLLVSTALFFCEKYLIEYTTKKFKDAYLSAYTRLYTSSIYFFNTFFCQVVIAMLYIIALAELWYICF